MSLGNSTINYFLIPVDQLPKEMIFGHTNMVMIIVYSFLMVASLLVNSVFLAILIRRRHRTRTHYLMINLCLSNFYLVLVEMPLQIAWNFMVYWTASDALCRAVSYFGIVGLYGNAFFTVAIALDRWQSISKTPPSNCCLPIQIHKYRTGYTILFAWVMAHICSTPQAIIYHVQEHPAYKNYHQCVTFNYFSSRLKEIAYNMCVTCLIYCVPLLALTGCSVTIWLYIRKHANSLKQSSNGSCAIHGSMSDGTSYPLSPAPSSSANRFQDRSLRFRCSTKRLLCRAEKQAFRLTVVFLTIFITCHTPFQIISVWRVMDDSLGDTLNPIVHRLLFACGVLPTIVDPIAYAKFLIPITNEIKVIMSRRRKSVSRRTLRTIPSEMEPDLQLTKITAADPLTNPKTHHLSPNYRSPPLHQSSVSSSRSLIRIHRASSWL